jgi:Putative metallopeptidase
MNKTKYLSILLLVWLGFGVSLAQEGKLELVFEASPTKAHQAIRRVLSKSQYLKDLIAFFSENLELPQNIPIHFQDCNEENAYYFPDQVYISMCYELLNKMAALESDVPPEDRYLDATNATLLHELGHALAHQLELPITGKEEDAVDEFSILALLKLNDEAGIQASIYQYQVEAEQINPEDQIYWDSHSLSAQRMYDMVCIAYGSGLDYYTDLANTTDIPQDRLEQCQQEYQDALYAWNTILEPYLKNPDGPLLLEPDEE